MSTLFTVGSGNAYLTINSATGGAATLVVSNPDSSQTTVALTQDQVRQFGTAAGSHIATGFVSSTIAGVGINSAFKILPADSSTNYNPPPTGINVTVPLSGTGAGQNYVQYLTQVQTEQIFNALLLFSVTNQ